MERRNEKKAQYIFPSTPGLFTTLYWPVTLLEKVMFFSKQSFY